MKEGSALLLEQFRLPVRSVFFTVHYTILFICLGDGLSIKLNKLSV